MGVDKREKVINGLECNLNFAEKSYCEQCGYECRKAMFISVPVNLLSDALLLLKAQEPATIEPKRIDLADETKAWLDKMDAVDALDNIANICMDWDGYRTANGLGGLINEIWAYARYSADRLLKAQEPVEPIPGLWDRDIQLYKCGACGGEIGAGGIAKYCFHCGRAVKWK